MMLRRRRTKLHIDAAWQLPHGFPDHRRRVLASAALAAAALDRNLPRAAMIGARSAARSALLALAAAPAHRPQVAELCLLRAMAASAPWLPDRRGGGEPAALSLDTILAVERLLAPPPPRGSSPGDAGHAPRRPARDDGAAAAGMLPHEAASRTGPAKPR